MSQFNDRTFVNSTRKEHKCFGCSGKIPIGSEAINNKGYFEDWYNYYLHPSCEKIIQKYNEFVEDGVFEGVIHEMLDYFGLDNITELLEENK